MTRQLIHFVPSFRSVGCAAMLAAFLAIVDTAPRAAEPVKLRVGWGTPPPTELLPIMLEPGVTKHNGVSYQMVDNHFRAATLQVMAMANGEIDIGLLPSTVFGFAVKNGGLDDLRYITDEFMDGMKGYFSSQFMTLNSSPITKVEDLKGKVLATNAIGGPGDLIIRTVLRAHGLEFKTDYTTIEAVFSTMQPLLFDRKADVVMITQPFYDNPVLQKGARTLFTTENGFGSIDMILWVARKDFIAAHRGAIVDLLEDYVRVSRWYQDPTNHAKAVEIIAGFNKLSEASQDYLFTKRDVYRNPDQIPDSEALQRTLHAQVGLGLLKDEFEIRKYAELGPIEEAVQRVK
jgi:sulfonate transport system substrate-binding protein